MMLRYLLVLAALTGAAPIAVADAGWIVNSRFAGGSLYAEKENQSVTLAEEVVLALFEPQPGEGDGAGTIVAHYTVHFLFRNDTDRDETLQVGFPVVAEVSSSPPVGTEMVYLVLDPRTAQDAWRKGEVPSLYNPLDDTGRIRRELSWDQFRREMGSYSQPGAAGRLLLDFKVEQDTQGSVFVEKVLLEGSGYLPELGSTPNARVTANMMFRLKFPARKTSLVTVDYRMYALAYEGRGGAEYRSRYVIGTGATWKGPIGKLYFVTTGDVENRPRGIESYDSDVHLLIAGDYEPESDEAIDVTYRSPQAPRSTLSGLGSARVDSTVEPNQDVSVRKASSSYPGEVKVADLDGSGQAVWRVTGYGPGALFDGIPTNAWVENVKGSGVGETVEFELLNPAVGLRIYNGLQMLPYGNGYEGYGDPAATALENKQIWQKNNRVKELTLTRVGGGSVTLTLQDRWGPQSFGGLFRPGVYRATIKSVYKGTTWDDTALGEMAFQTIPAHWLMSSESPELWEALLAPAP